MAGRVAHDSLRRDLSVAQPGGVSGRALNTTPMLLALFGLGGWEVVLLLAIIVVLLAARHLPPLGRGLKEGIDQFREATDEVTAELRKTADIDKKDAGPAFSVRLFVAQGFGIGWIPFAPGTFGSLLGLAWFAMLVATGSFWAYLAGAIEGIA